MKEIYCKPHLRVERFTLTQNIASSCGGTAPDATWGAPSLADKATCGWQLFPADGAPIIWLDAAASNCTQTAGASDEINGICYNNPAGIFTIFTS